MKKTFTICVLALCLGCGGEQDQPASTTPEDMSMMGDEGVSLDMGDASRDASARPDQGVTRDECELLVQCLLGCEDDTFVCSATCSTGLSAEPSASAANLAACLAGANCQDEACAQSSCAAELMACRGELPEEEDMDMTRDMGTGGMMLPEAGYTACEGKMRMESCMWTSRMGEITGRCVRIPQSQDPRQFCVPEDRFGGRDMGVSGDMDAIDM